MTATMEEAEKTMEKVGEQGEGAAANMARLEANVDNLKIEIGNRFLPVLTTITDKLLVMWDDPQIQQGLDNLFDWIEKVVGDEDSGLIGMITLLASGDIEGAFDAVFGKGQGVYKIISGFVDFFDRSFQGIEFAIDTVKTALENIANSPAMNDFINRKSQVENWLGGSTAVGTAAKNVATSKMGRVGGSSRTYYQGGRASGGSVSAGGSYLVGEQGPEVLKMGGNSGYITPNKLGGATIVFNLNSVVSLADMENAKRVLQPIVESGLRTVMAR